MLVINRKGKVRVIFIFNIVTKIKYFEWESDSQRDWELGRMLGSSWGLLISMYCLIISCLLLA